MKQVYRLNIQVQGTKNSPNHIGQLAFGYKINEITWRVKTYFGKVIELFDDEINNIFNVVPLKNPTW